MNRSVIGGLALIALMAAGAVYAVQHFRRPGSMTPVEAQAMERQIKKPADLDAVAKAQGLQVQETGFFARDEPILGVGSAPEMTARAFEMKAGEVSGALRTGRGFAFETLTARQDPYIPKVEEVKERVREELLKQRAREFAKRKATDLSAKLKGTSDFEKVVKASGFDAKTTELLTRDSPIPDLGVASEVMDAAFKLPSGGVSDPITTDTGVAIIKVLEKQEITPSDLSSNKDSFREDLLADRRNRFFSAYMIKAKQKMQIEVNREALKRAVG